MGGSRAIAGLLRLVLVAAMLAWVGAASPVLAQGSPDRGDLDRSTISPDLAAEQTAITARIRARVEAIETEIASPTIDDATLVERRFELQQIARRLSDIGFVFRPRIEAIDARLAEIGPLPEDGQSEPEALASERQSLIDERLQINTVLGEVEQLGTRVAGLTLRVTQLRRDLFTEQLSTRYDILTAFSSEVLEDFGTEATRLVAAVSSWATFVVRYNLVSAVLAGLMALGAAALLTFGLRSVASRLLVTGESATAPPFISRLSVAFWSTFLPSAALGIFLAATWYFLDYFGLLRDDIGRLLNTLFRVVAIVFFVSRLARAIFSPDRPEWRLIGFETQAARSLYRLVFGMAVVTGADVFLATVSSELGSPLSVTVARSLVAALIMGGLLF
jgi:potassium efflux system protein